MAGIWVHGEIAGDGSLAKLSTEVATLARAIAARDGRAEVIGIVIGSDPARPPSELARFVPKVLTVTEPTTADHAAGMIVAQRLAALIEAHEPDIVMTGAGPEGRDLAGGLSALTGWGVLANATAVRARPTARSRPTACSAASSSPRARLDGGKGIVTVRPNSVTAEPAARPARSRPPP